MVKQAGLERVADVYPDWVVQDDKWVLVSLLAGDRQSDSQGTEGSSFVSPATSAEVKRKRESSPEEYSMSVEDEMVCFGAGDADLGAAGGTNESAKKARRPRMHI
ncbi:hypothetical protein LTR85_004952 [Meristemomyces frigidus]|nr:hypothetical protein LTR85_004952 [Meristemomyces frigidus]